MFWKKRKIIFFILIFASLFLMGKIFYWKRDNTNFNLSNMNEIQEGKIEQKHYPTPEKPPLPPPSMEILKKKGCVADGILFGYEGKDNAALKMINRSKCQYLHRAIETWLAPPDFKKIAKRKKKIIRKNIVYGMFIAEAIDKKANYYYPVEERYFNFSKMCRKGSENFWGEHTCKPSFERSEYRKYLRYIIEQAIDQGIQVFLFGQIFYQEKTDLNHPLAGEIIEEMREYAAFKGTSILVGAQTNNIENENYLRLFDFIEGGVGLSKEGTVESGPCFSRWWNQKNGGWCWALLWNEKYSKKANNVLLHLDWSGKWGDDMNTFSRMTKIERENVLKNLYTYFTSRDFGFLMPMLAILNKASDGCYGDKKKYYSADYKYSCQDEGIINSILEKAK
jgi:hypothetical protein